VKAPFHLIEPRALAHVERTGTALDRVLAANIRALAGRLGTAELLLGRMRQALNLAVEIVSPPGDSTEVNDKAIDAFVELALDLADEKAATAAYRDWARAQHAASLAAEGGKPREYYIEVAREILRLPAKDGAARSLVKLDLERILKTSEAFVESTLLEEEESQPKVADDTP